MKVKVKDDPTPGIFRLPDDYHVPPGLRTPEDVTEQELQDARTALMDYDADHSRKQERRKARDRKHGSGGG